MEPFSVTCTTCHARLKILDAAAIGQIHACPRCGGMVRIIAPVDAPAAAEAQPAVASTPPASATQAENKESSPLSLAEIASQASAVANDTPAVTPTAPRSLWSDPRIAWVCVPLAALLTGLIVWNSRGASALLEEDGSSTVAEVEPITTTTPPDATPPANQAPANKPADPSATPALPPLPGTKAAEGAKPEPAPPAANNEPAKQMTPEKAPPANADLSTTPAPAAPPPAKVEPPPANPAPAPKQPMSVAPSLLAPSKGGNVAKSEPVAPQAPAVEPPAAAAPEIPKPDIAARLTNTLERIEFPNVALYDLLHFLSRATQVPIAYDFDALAERNVKLEQTLVVKKYNLTIAELLRGLFTDLGLGWQVEDYQLRVIVADRLPTKLVAQTHSTEAFTRETPEQLGGLIRSLIEPDAWIEADGRGTLKIVGRGLLIEQTPAVQRDVQRLLTSLHQLRDKAYANEPRYNRASAKLATPIQANFPGPTPLTTIIEHLRKHYRLITLVDHAALAAEGKTAQHPVSLVAHDQPLGPALTAALEPQGLVMRVLDATTIEITTVAGAETQPDLEFYPLGKFAAANESADVVLERLTKQLPEIVWHGVGGNVRGGGTIGVDSATGTLIVRHSQLVQRRVAELLAK